MTGNFPPHVSNADWDRYDRSQVEAEEELEQEEIEPLSDCCGAEMLGSEEDPICSECKEHCEVSTYRD